MTAKSAMPTQSTSTESFEQRLTVACGCPEAIGIGAQADARIAEIERELAIIQAALEQEYEASKAKDERIAELESRNAEAERRYNEHLAEQGYLHMPVVHEEQLGKLRRHVASLKSDLRDRDAWIWQYNENSRKIGEALDRVRKKRDTGLPARSDAQEVRDLVNRVLELERRLTEWEAHDCPLQGLPATVEVRKR